MIRSTNSQRGGTRRLLGRLPVVVLAVVASVGCDWVKGVTDGRPATLLVVLVDVSTSSDNENWDLFRKAYAEAVTALLPGDRLVLAGITDASLTRFTPLADRSLPVTGVQMDDEDAAKAIRTELANAFAGLGQIKSARTKIVDAIHAVAQQVIAADAQRKATLLLLSDMLEVSEQMNFERAAPAPDATEKFIASRRAQKAVAEIPGTSVIVVGASAPNEQHYRRVQEFWSAYFRAMGATVTAYGRTVPRFSE